jgi:hypothetical protein
MFIALEAEAQHPLTQQVITRRRSCVDYLWNSKSLVFRPSTRNFPINFLFCLTVTHHLNVLNYDQWRQDVNRTVFE